MEFPNEFSRWDDFLDWSKQFKKNQKQYIFRGQGNAEWPVKSSLARYFISEQNVDEHQWRIRETMMYKSFREMLIDGKDGEKYKVLTSSQILALMQHYGAPTRLIDFTYSPMVAAYFALKQAMNTSSAIWVIDANKMKNIIQNKNLPNYFGPKHDNDKYYIEKKIYQNTHDFFINFIGEEDVAYDNKTNKRLGSQNGCFINPNRISKTIPKEMFHSKVVIPSEIKYEEIFCYKDDIKYFKDIDLKEHLAFRSKRFSIFHDVQDFDER